MTRWPDSSPPWPGGEVNQYIQCAVTSSTAAAVRGRLTANAPIGPLTWFRVGGPAEVLFRPADPEDLADSLRPRRLRFR